MWLSWQVAAQVAVVLLAVCLVARYLVTADRWKPVGPLTTLGFETTRMFVLYALWQYVKEASGDRSDGAYSRGRWIWNFEQRWHFPSELAIENAVLHHRWFMQFLNIYYGGVHVPALGIVLVWMYFRHREDYHKVRNVVALTTAGCMFIQMVPVAPPRLLPDLGFVDEAILLHQSVYGTGGGVSNQLAAMPSLHYAWAFIVTLAVLRYSTSKHRWWVLTHLILTTLAVTATANHWFLDGVVAGMVMVVAIAIQMAATRAWAVVRARRAVAVPVTIEPGLMPEPAQS